MRVCIPHNLPADCPPLHGSGPRTQERWSNLACGFCLPWQAPPRTQSSHDVLLMEAEWLATDMAQVHMVAK